MDREQPPGGATTAVTSPSAGAPAGITLESPAIRFRQLGLSNKMLWAALAMVVIGPLSFLVAPFCDPFTDDSLVVGLVGFMLVLYSPATAFLAWLLRVVSVRTAGSLTVVGDRLVVRRWRSERSFPLARVSAGFTDPLREEVEIRLSNGDSIRAKTPFDRGAALLSAAGLDASSRTLAMRLGETRLHGLLVFLLGSTAPAIATAFALRAGLPGALAPATFCALFALMFWSVRRLLGPADLVIGADGVVIRQSFTTRFVPFERIAAMTFRPNEVVFVLQDGSEQSARTRSLSPAQLAQLRARFHEAKEAWATGGVAPAALMRLDPRARDAKAWRQDLRALLVRGDDYRSAALTSDDLARIVDSPHARAPRRIAAAVALAAAADGAASEARKRIRIAADACAEPRARLALKRAADGDEEAALEEALVLEREGALDLTARDGKAKST